MAKQTLKWTHAGHHTEVDVHYMKKFYKPPGGSLTWGERNRSWVQLGDSKIDDHAICNVFKARKLFATQDYSEATIKNYGQCISPFLFS